jgi:hypothetical protein
MAATVLVRVGLDYLNVQGFFLQFLDYSVPIYFFIAIIIDEFDIGIRIKCLLFDLVIAFMANMTVFVLLVIVAYMLELLIGFFQYVVFV